MEYLTDVEEGGIFHDGQTTDNFGNTEQSLDFSNPSMVAQNNVDSNAIMAQPEAPVPQATLVANTSMPNQGFYNPFMVAQNNVESNAIMAQPGAPVPQATLVANTSMPNQGRSQSEAAIRSRESRERQKKRKTEIDGIMEALTQGNKALKDELRASKAENTRLNQALQSRGEEMDKLKRDLNRLTADHKKQVAIVNGLSEKLVGSDFSPRDEEIQKLKNEIDLLRQGKGMDNLCLQLMKENAKLKLQLDAVCDKLLAENPSP